MKRLRLFICLLLIPVGVDASVYFSEIAWMGSTDSANQEWIELHNTGPATSVDGWTITDSNNLSIELTGTLPANAYSVLERIDDTSAPGTAFLIYSGSLVNSGATLQLTRADGSLVDQVSGGEDWSNIGGNNDTKETAQYSTSGWMTGPATPGAVANESQLHDNQSEIEVEADSSDTTAEASATTRSRNSSSGSGSSGPTKTLTLPDVSLQLSIDAPGMGYVNQPINFSATASGIGTTLINSLTYEWNFGDGNMSTHVTPEHTFRHPGKYVVTAYASFKRQEQIARHEITILPVMLSLGTNRQGDVVVYNEAQYELDLSHYYLKGEKVFSFPPRTYVLPNQSIVISQDKVGQTDNQVVAMYDPKGTSLDMLMPPNLAPPTRMLATTDTPPAPAVAGATYSPPLPSRDPGLHTISPDSSRSDQPAPSRVATAELTPPTQPEAPVRSVTDTATPVRHQWPYLALIGLIILGIAGAFLTQRPASNQSD